MKEKKPEALKKYTAILSGQKSGKRGRPPLPRPPGRDLKRLYVREGRSVREIAGILGITKDRVFKALREAGIERRPGVKRSRLRAFSLDVIEETVRAHTMKDAAAILGVPKRTLQDYRAKHKRDGRAGRGNTPNTATAGKRPKPMRKRAKGQK